MAGYVSNFHSFWVIADECYSWPDGVPGLRQEGVPMGKGLEAARSQYWVDFMWRFAHVISPLIEIYWPLSVQRLVMLTGIMWYCENWRQSLIITLCTVCANSPFITCILMNDLVYTVSQGKHEVNVMGRMYKHNSSPKFTLRTHDNPRNSCSRRESAWNHSFSHRPRQDWARLDEKINGVRFASVYPFHLGLIHYTVVLMSGMSGMITCSHHVHS